MKLFCAAAIAPMDHRPLLREAAVVVNGPMIVDVGPIAAMRRQYAANEAVDLGDVLLTPGLINAHTHLELSHAPRPPAGLALADWALDLIRGRVALGDNIAPASARAAADGAAESLAFGVTCVGDVTALPLATRPALATSPIRVVSFGEVRAMAGRRGGLADHLSAATDETWDDWGGEARVLTAVSPHAPYSVEPAGYAACLQWARAHGRPLTTHLAETPDEAAFLASHVGPFRRLWESLGGWADDVPRFAGGPVRLAKSLGLLDYPTLLAHVNYPGGDDELALLAAGRASVVWCPRTHAYFGHPPHPFADLLASGVNVCLGTDSRASSPDLNVLEEARLVRRRRPDLAAPLLWEMITSRAAAALGVGSQLGAIAAGRCADLCAWPLPRGADPLGALLEPRAAAPADVWIAGARLAPPRGQVARP